MGYGVVSDCQDKWKLAMASIHIVRFVEPLELRWGYVGVEDKKMRNIIGLVLIRLC